MRRARAHVLAFLGTLVLATPAVADDFKWDPKKQRRNPTVGARRFEEYTETMKNATKVKVGEQVVKNTKEEGTVTVRLIREILAVDGDRATKEKFTVEKWSRQTSDDDEADTSLAGKTVVVDASGDVPTFTFEGDAKVSEGAELWVKKELAKPRKKKSDEPEAMDPKEPVAPDGEWTIDPALLAKELFKTEADPEKSKAKGKLSDVRVVDGKHFGKVGIDASIQLKTMPGAPLEWSEGGLLVMGVRAESVLDPGIERKNGTLSMEMTLKGKAKQESPQGEVKISLDIHFKREGKLGDLPPAEVKDGEKKPAEKPAEKP